MQSFLYALLIALANNVDNLGARIAYSIQGTRIDVAVNFWISVITFVISSVAAFFGAKITGYLGAEVGSETAMVLLIVLGAWMIVQARRENRQNGDSSSEKSDLLGILLKPERADIDQSRNIDFKEGTVLGIALSINNIGGGISAGMIGLNPFAIGLLSAIISFIALWAGNYVAEFFGRRQMADKAAVLGGVLLIIIGIKQVF